ncbi:hypothetical protein N4G62_13425 [Sphingomonas sanguinis]|uniref:Sulfatase N-terminal domain-containing protein n=1 Tax=Sphingomonas sanguinis TaxID=33051 RepID=A0ABU5LTE5_9SPHN|nr:hypothetical protein [Sphingomonas sanguinis]MDZ7283026.1 hypothetical protein [Sphingomonas sanguinis]
MTLLYTAVFFVLPNVPYWFWLNNLAPTRAVINIDYLVLGIFSVFFSRKYVVPLYIILCVVDAFVFVSKLYHFSPREFVYSTSYIRYSPVGLANSLSVGTFITLVLFVISILVIRKIALCKDIFISGFLAILLTVTIFLDFISGSNTVPLFTRLPFYSRVQRIGINPANSGVFGLDIYSFLPNRSKPVMTNVPSASRIAIGKLAKYDGSGRNVAIVLVESWGKIENNEDFTDIIARPLFSQPILKKYRVDRGSIPFHGSTTNAELRELCGLYGNYRDIFTVHPKNCLPKLFGDMGYQTTGLHGFYADMFDRISWWPIVGIKHKIFLNDFKGIRRCGTAFPAVCDDYLVDKMGDTLTKTHQFVYALTINSHLPLPDELDNGSGLRCFEFSKLSDNAPCVLAQKIRRVLTAVAQNALRNDIKPTQFIIVGDHSPPFLGSINEEFSSTHVPYIILTPT